MYKAQFNPEWYSSEAYYFKEWDNLFSKVWLFAGFNNRLRGNGSYFVIELFGKEIVVHDFNGEIKAYQNACPHRGGPFYLDKDGKGFPSCLYHGWTFENAKDLSFISHHDWFSEDCSEDSCARQLNYLRVQLIGPCIFVSFDLDGIDISDQFSDEVLDTLRGLGELSDLGVFEYESKINWKLNMENVKDFLHPFYIHPSSFKPLLNFEAPRGSKLSNFGDDSSLKPFDVSQSLQDLSYVNWADLSIDGQWWASKINMTQPDDRYINIFLFPSTNLYSVSGGFYGAQQYLPKSATTFNYVLSAAIPSKKEDFSTSALLQTILKLERDVINEDDLILNKVQKNLSSGLKDDFFAQGDYEHRLMAQMSYLNKHVYRLK